jgi:hypothetical protein
MNTLNYNKEFGRTRDKPGFFSILFAGVIRILPKIGPLRALKFKAPSAEVEKLYLQSFDTVQLHYSNALKALHSRRFVLKDKDYDTGNDTQPGEYQLTDDTYCDLVLALADKNSIVSSELRQNITEFFKNGVALSDKKKGRKEKTARALDQLKR